MDEKDDFGMDPSDTDIRDDDNDITTTKNHSENNSNGEELYMEPSKHQDTCVKCEVNFSTLDPTAGHGCVGPLSYCKSCFLLNKDKDCVLRQNQLGEDSEMPSTS